MRQVLTGLLIGTAMIVAALGLKYLHAQGVIAGSAEEISQRSFNIILGLLLVWMTNLAPKTLPPLAAMSRDLAGEQSLRRFISITLVIGGLLYSLIWLIAPYDLASTLSIAALGSALVIAIGRVFRCFARAFSKLR